MRWYISRQFEFRKAKKIIYEYFADLISCHLAVSEKTDSAYKYFQPIHCLRLISIYRKSKEYLTFDVLRIREPYVFSPQS